MLVHYTKQCNFFWFEDVWLGVLSVHFTYSACLKNMSTKNTWLLHDIHVMFKLVVVLDVRTQTHYYVLKHKLSNIFRHWSTHRASKCSTAVFAYHVQHDSLLSTPSRVRYNDLASKVLHFHSWSMVDEQETRAVWIFAVPMLAHTWSYLWPPTW